MPPPVLHQPLLEGHARNDHQRARPLLDALAHGFTSVGIDVWSVGGTLLLGSDWPDRGRRLDVEYLEPLAELVRANGAVFPGRDIPVRLLIDIRSIAAPTWQALERALVDYAPMMTAAVDGRVFPGAVTAIISGHRDLAALEAAPVRRCFADGRVADLGRGIPPAVMPLVSDSWAAHFSWVGESAMGERDRRTLRGLVDRVHDEGRLLRFYGTWDWAGPQRDRLWSELLDAGVDLISTDDLAGFADFCAGRR
ncbi:MAG: hypothetical protein LWW86_05675 [Micrococcales bacterium]|nr:hypothetical protein [Micrococcales bacterium]